LWCELLDNETSRWEPRPIQPNIKGGRYFWEVRLAKNTRYARAADCQEE
jgi:hypothetical protein